MWGSIFINVLLIAIFILFLAVSEGYCLGMTLQGFFDNKIENAEKRLKNYDAQSRMMGDWKTLIKRMRYRCTGGFWRLLFKILTVPGWLVGFLLNTLAYEICLLFAKVFRLKDNSTTQIVIEGLTKVVRFTLCFGLYRMISANINKIMAGDEGNIEGSFGIVIAVTIFNYVAKIVIQFLEMVLFVGLLCPQMEDIKFLNMCCEKTNKFAQDLYDYADGSRNTLATMSADLFQRIITTVTDFLGNFKIWRDFKLFHNPWFDEMDSVGDKIKKILAIYIPIGVVVLITSIVFEYQGKTISASAYLTENLEIIGTFWSWAEAWVILFCGRAVGFVLLKGIQKLSPAIYCRVLTSAESVSESCVNMEQAINRVQHKAEEKVWRKTSERHTKGQDNPYDGNSKFATDASRANEQSLREIEWK